jgi:RNA polymerase sigma-70 factor (ECF subfamily)
MAGQDPFENPEELLRRVYAYVAYRVGNRADAEDITSEAFERALRYRRSFDSRKGAPIGWLLGIARNCVYDAQLRPRPQPTDEDPPAAEGFEDAVVAKAELAAALEMLDARDRELIALRYGSDLTAREIAKLLDMRTNAVEVALTRARSRLAAVLDAGTSAGRQRGDHAVANIADDAL